jgi:hypothetical protein
MIIAKESCERQPHLPRLTSASSAAR